MNDDLSIEEIKEQLMSEPVQTLSISEIPADRMLSTGSLILDLAISGRRDGGMAKGMYFPFIGESSAGKTLLALTCLAEASINPNFDDYRFVFDNVENGAQMNWAKYFGQACADRIKAPTENGASRYLDEYYSNSIRWFDEGPTIYICDSENALPLRQDEELFAEQTKAHEKGKEAPKSYGMGRAKFHSNHINMQHRAMMRHDSILILLCQARTAVGATMYEPQSTRSGGTAITFYAQAELWFEKGAVLKKKIEDKDHKIGQMSKVKVEKNRLSGKNRTVFIPMYYSLGIDPIGSTIKWMLDNKQWVKNTKGVVVPELDLNMTEEKLAQHIQTEELEDELAIIVENAWNGLEGKLSINRKTRYN